MCYSIYLVRSTFNLRLIIDILMLAYLDICAIAHFDHIRLAFAKLLLVEGALADHHPDLGLVIH